MTISRVVFRFDLVVDTEGTVETFYATTHGFTTKPTDTPANTYIAEHVAKDGAGSYRRDLFSAARVAGGSSPSFGVIKLDNTDGRLDDFARFAAAGGDVTCYYGDDSKAFPSAYFVVYVSQIAAVVADFEAITIRQKDRADKLRTPVVTATFAGTGDLEGSSGGPGRKKQLIIGKPGLVPLIPVDTTKQIYYIQANAIEASAAAGSGYLSILEGGIPIERGQNYTFADFLWSTEPDLGEFRLWSGYGGTEFGGKSGDVADANAYTRGPIFARLKAPPQAELRYQGLGLLQNEDDVPPRRWRFTDLCNRAGLNDVTPLTLAPAPGGSEDFDVGNRLIEGDQTYEAVMNDRAVSLNGAWGFNAQGLFYCITLQDPMSGLGSSVYTFTTENADEFSRTPIAGMERPVWQVNVKSGRSHPAAPLEAASAEMHDLLTRDGWLVQFAGAAAALKERYANALSVSIEIDGNEFEDPASRQAFVDAFGILYGTQRDFVSLKCKRFDADTLAITLHDKVTLQLARFGYDAGVLFRVVAIEVNLDEPSIRFVLWGNNSGFETWALTGGSYPPGNGEPGGSWGPGGPPDGTRTLEDKTSTFDDFDFEFFVAPTAEAGADFEIDDFVISTDSEIVAAVTDPDFANVALLLHFDGSDGSTTITDSSSYADSKTSSSPILIETSDSVWGGSCLAYPSGTSSGATGASWTPGAARFARAGGSAYTVELWFKKTGATTAGAVARLFNGSVLWRLQATSTSNGWQITVGGTSTNFTVTTGDWHFLQTVVGTDNVAVTKVDGTTVQTTGALSAWTGTPYPILNTSATVSGGDLRIDDLRITPGVARAFAVPTEAFPDA